MKPRRAWLGLRPGDLWATGIALLLLLAWDSSGADLWLARAWGDAHGFAWRDRWLTSRLLHDGGRLLGWLVLAGIATSAIWPRWGRLTRSERLHWLGVTLLLLLLVPMLKRYSSTSCPWDLAEFGGHALYISHWRFGISDGGAGHCFPSGHATAAVAFFSGWFALRDAHPRAARLWLAAVCAFALLFGWAQMARGAHYASHTLWSAWMCWTLAMLAHAPRRVAAALQRAAP